MGMERAIIREYADNLARRGMIYQAPTRKLDALIMARVERNCKSV